MFITVLLLFYLCSFSHLVVNTINVCSYREDCFIALNINQLQSN